MAFFNFELLIEQWQSVGVFSVILPLILIFAVVFAILQRSKILGAKTGIDAVVSLAVAALALQTNFVATFFRELFPRAAMGLSVLLVMIIIFGLLIIGEREKGKAFTAFASVAALIIFITVLAQTYSGYSWFSGRVWWEENKGWVIGLIALIGIFLAIIIPSAREKEK